MALKAVRPPYTAMAGRHAPRRNLVRAWVWWFCLSGGLLTTQPGPGQEIQLPPPLANPPELAAHAPRLTAAWVVSAVSGEALPSTDHKRLVTGPSVQLHAVVQDANQRWYADVPQVRIGGRTVRTRPWEPARWGQLDLTWHTVEPFPWHIDGPAPDDQKPEDWCYANSAPPGSPRQYEWLKIDPIEYFSAPLANGRGRWQITADQRPSFPAVFAMPGLGVMRYQVQAAWHAIGNPTPVQLVASAGADATDQLGLTDRVHRIVWRHDDSFLGQLTGYFNVPGVFGSLPQQVDRYLGADCADLMVGAWRQLHGPQAMDYTNVAGLRQSMEPLCEPVYMGLDGRLYASHVEAATHMTEVLKLPLATEQLYQGYVVTFALNALGERWFHVGAIVQDRGPDGEPDGVLGGADLVLHAARTGVRIDRLGELALSLSQPAKLQVFTWRAPAAGGTERR